MNCGFQVCSGHAKQQLLDEYNEAMADYCDKLNSRDWSAWMDARYRLNEIEERLLGSCTRCKDEDK